MDPTTCPRIHGLHVVELHGSRDLFNFEWKFMEVSHAGLRPCTPPAAQIGPSSYSKLLGAIVITRPIWVSPSRGQIHKHPGQLFSQMNYEKIKRGQISPKNLGKKLVGNRYPPLGVFPLINIPLIYGFFTPTGRPLCGRQAEPDEKPVNQGDIYEGENAQGGVPISNQFLT